MTNGKTTRTPPLQSPAISDNEIMPSKRPAAGPSSPLPEKPQGMLQKIEHYLLNKRLHWLQQRYSRDEQLPGLANFTGVNRILVVSHHARVGDFLMATPVLRALRAHFPGARIGLLVREYLADLAQNNPYVDELLVVPEHFRRKTLGRLLMLWRQLFRKWDMAICLNLENHLLVFDLLAHFSGARFILGSEKHQFPGTSRNFFYNLVAPNWEPVRHQSERNLDILRHIGVDTDDLTEVIGITSEEREQALEALENQGIDAEAPVIGFYIGAGRLFERWPIGRFGELAQQLHERFQAQVVLFSGPNEDQLTSHFRNYLRFEPVRVERAPLRKLAAFFTCCDALVCNATAMMHLAAAAGVPLLAIFGPIDPVVYKPFGDKFVALRGAKNRTDDITTARATQALVQLLGSRLSHFEIAMPEEPEPKSTPVGLLPAPTRLTFDISDSIVDQYADALDSTNHD